MKFVIDDRIPFIKGILEPYADIEYHNGSDISGKILKDADGLIVRTRTLVDRNLLTGTKIKFVGTATIGTDHIDTVWCEENGIYWTSAPGCNSGSVMQYLAASLAYIQTKLSLIPEQTTLGIIGVGNVGSKVSRMAKILGYKVLLNDPPRCRAEGKAEFTELNELISNSDIVSLHVPLIKTGSFPTFQFVDKNFLALMKKGASLINTSRGSVINEKDLIKSITKYRPGAVVLDVWEGEPQLNIDLLKMVDIGTPHIAGYSIDGKAQGTGMIVRGLANFFDLPLKDWEPDDLSEPENRNIHIPEKPESLIEKMNAIIKHTYPIEDDSLLLKTYPEKFEYLRGNYRQRREFGAFTIDGSKSLIEKGRDLGFKQG